MADFSRLPRFRRIWRSWLFWLFCALTLAGSLYTIADQSTSPQKVNQTSTPVKPLEIVPSNTAVIAATAGRSGARIPPSIWAPHPVLQGSDGIWRLRPGIDLTDTMAAQAGWGYAVTNPNRVSPSGLMTMRFQRQSGSAIIFFAGLDNSQLYTLSIELGTSQCYDSTDLHAGGRFIGDIGGPTQTKPVQSYPFTIPRDVIGADGVLVLYLTNTTNANRCSLDSAPIYSITIKPQTKHQAPGSPPGACYSLRNQSYFMPIDSPLQPNSTSKPHLTFWSR